MLLFVAIHSNKDDAFNNLDLEYNFSKEVLMKLF